MNIYKKVANRLSQHLKYRKESFSQCGEDLIVYYIFQNIIKNPFPTYIDIGAHHPYNLSNTALLYEKGCKGINIEPNPILFKQFERYRKKDINLNVGVSDQSRKLIFYNLSDPALSTFAKEEADILIKNKRIDLEKEYLIDVIDINEIITNYSQDVFPNFLSLDVEGFDEQILKAVNYEKYRPDVICVETIKYTSDGKFIKNDTIIELLQTKGYTLYADTRINSIFVLQNYMNYSL